MGFSNFFQRLARVSNSGAIAPTYANDDAVAPLCDEFGRLWVNASPAPPVPISLSYYDSIAREASAVVIAGVSRLWNVTANHTVLNTLYYMQVFDAVAAVPGAVPIYTVPVFSNTGQGNITLSAGSGRGFTNGIVVALSSNASIYAAVGNVGWFNVAYQ